MTIAMHNTINRHAFILFSTNSIAGIQFMLSIISNKLQINRIYDILPLIMQVVLNLNQQNCGLKLLFCNFCSSQVAGKANRAEGEKRNNV